MTLDNFSAKDQWFLSYRYRDDKLKRNNEDNRGTYVLIVRDTTTYAGIRMFQEARRSQNRIIDAFIDTHTHTYICVCINIYPIIIYRKHLTVRYF